MASGIINLPRTDALNQKMAHAILHCACWLQGVIDALAAEEDEHYAMNTSDGTHNDPFYFVLLGPGGTGKTSVIIIVTELIRYFFCHEAVKLMAPTNAAARLIGGDTAHALCKLPLESSTNSRLRLGPKILEKFQQFWDPTVFAWHDEISMQSSTNFYWIGRRMSQAKAIRKDEKDIECFGGLAMGMAGVFLQIPPVSKSTSRNPS